MQIRDYIDAVLSYHDGDVEYLELQKDKRLPKRIIEFIDRDIEQIKLLEKYNITNEQIDEIEAFLEELLCIKEQDDKHHTSYPLNNAKNILSDLYSGLYFALENDTVIDQWDNFDDTTILQMLVEEIISTFHYLNIIDKSIPNDRGKKINEAAEYILRFSDDAHLHYHLNRLLKTMPERKNQIRKVHKHFFYVIAKTFKQLKPYTNDELECFLNLLLNNIFNAKSDRITGNTAILYLYSRPLKYFTR